MPTRIIDGKWLTSQKLDQTSAEGKRLYSRLILAGDDFGRFSADPALVASACFPRRRSISEAEVAVWFDELESVGLIVRYQHRNDTYLAIVNPRQRTRAQASKYPNPPQTLVAAIGGQQSSDVSESPQSAAERGQALAIAPGDGDGDGNGDGDGDGDVTPDRERTKSTKRNDIAFDAFWAVYPTKQGKIAARKRFDEAIARGADPADIIAGAKRYRDDPNRGKTKFPEGWLSAGRWEDGPLPPMDDPKPGGPPSTRPLPIHESAPPEARMSDADRAAAAEVLRARQTA